VFTAAVVVGVGVEQGIILAIVVSLILHVDRHYRPRNAVVGWDSSGAFETLPVEPGRVSEPGLIVYRFGVGLFYANVSRLADEVTALVDVADPPRWFVLHAVAIDDVDYTGGQALSELARELARLNIVFAVADAGPQLQRELDRFGVTKEIGSDHVFDSLESARAAFHAARDDKTEGER
jgi:MFS superfamily sulfate permease-like transporter